MRIKIPKLRLNRKPKNPGGKGKVQQAVERIFGFEKPDNGKFFKSPELDAEAVVVQLARLQTDANWVKRLLWLVIAGSSAQHFIGG